MPGTTLHMEYTGKATPESRGSGAPIDINSAFTGIAVCPNCLVPAYWKFQITRFVPLWIPQGCLNVTGPVKPSPNKQDDTVFAGCEAVNFAVPIFRLQSDPIIVDLNSPPGQLSIEVQPWIFYFLSRYAAYDLSRRPGKRSAKCSSIFDSS